MYIDWCRWYYTVIMSVYIRFCADSNCVYMHAGYGIAISSRFAAMPSFANMGQSTILQLALIFFNQVVICIWAR